MAWRWRWRWRSYLENFLREFVLSHRLCNGRDEPHSSHGGYVCCAWFCPVLVEPKQLCTKRATTRNECPGRSAKREDLSSKNLRGICPESPVVACARFKTTLRLLPFLLSLSLSLSLSLFFFFFLSCRQEKFPYGKLPLRLKANIYSKWVLWFGINFPFLCLVVFGETRRRTHEDEASERFFLTTS